MAQTTRESGPWAALIQAHLANITTHKATLEALAQNMDAQQTLDATLVANMETMYSRTVEILQQAETVKEYFNGLEGARPRAVPRPNSKAKDSVLEASAHTVRGKVTAGRRQRRDSSNDTVEHQTSKRRRVVEQSTRSTPVTQVQPPPETDVEYVDVSKEVLRRLAASRQRRMEKKPVVAQDQGNTSRKRQRQSSGSERTAELLQMSQKRPATMRSRSGASSEELTAPEEAAKTFVSAEEDHTASMPGAFEDEGGKLREKLKVMRSKSIV